MRTGSFEKVALVVGALFLLLGNVFVIYKNFDTEWRHYQSEYLEMAVDKTDNPQMKEILQARSPRIEQLIIEDFGERRVDRCTTCHAGIDDDRFKDAPQPFTKHPELAGTHSYSEFGCTTCHAGNGRGLSVEDGHGMDRFWEEPLLTGDYIEIGCAKCHPSPYLEETPFLAEGAELFKTKACYGCHQVDRISNGKLGPALTRVGGKWPIEYLEESILEPKANNHESMMPTMDLTEREVKALTIYLKSLTGENLVEGSVTQYEAVRQWKSEPPGEVPATLESGRQVFEDKACTACHSVLGEGGEIGPDLSVYGLQRTKEWMIQHHVDPRSLVGGSIMPDFTYSESELEALGLYLSSLKDRPDQSEPVTEGGED
jgi:cbb3-type cytochrome oxidase cytochrome c subunit